MKQIGFEFLKTEDVTLILLMFSNTMIFSIEGTHLLFFNYRPALLSIEELY